MGHKNPFAVGGQIATGLSLGTATNTINTFYTIFAPYAGAKILRWGIKKRTAGTGTGTYSVTLRERGSSVDITEAMIVDADAAAETYQEALGDGHSQISTAGKELDVRVVVSGSISVTASDCDLWVVWQ